MHNLPLSTTIAAASTTAWLLGLPTSPLGLSWRARMTSRSR
jgi:hypothetical protein